MGNRNKASGKRASQGFGSLFHFDGLLWAFLVVGWTLIFASATLALQRNSQQWLPVRIQSQVAVDYSVEDIEIPRLAPVRQQVIEVVKQDALAARLPATPVSSAKPTATSLSLSGLIFRHTPTLTPQPTPTLMAVSAGGPYNGREGFPISLVARVSGPVATNIIYNWDLDNDGAFDDAAGASTTVVFDDEGDYKVAVQVVDATGLTVKAASMVHVQNMPPIVNAGRDKYAGEGEEISFVASVRDPGRDELQYYWDFGDGTRVDNSLRTRHTYADDGDYSVHFRAADNDGGVTDVAVVAHISNLPPTVEAGADREVNEGDSITLTAFAADPGVHDTLRYEWDFDYDGATFTPDALGQTVSSVYPDGPALMVAAVRAIDQDGGEAIDTVNVRVANLAPRILGVTNDGPVGEGSPLTLAVSATDVVSDALTYTFDWDGDGNPDGSSRQSTVSHTWQDEGDYPVSILIDDGDSAQVVTITTVSVYNMNPTAIAGPPVVGFEGSSITFGGGRSTDPGALDTLSYVWDFGDGNPMAESVTTTHSYADNGFYTATLTVRDNDGGSGTAAVAVAVLNANPDVAVDEGLSVDEGIPFQITASVSDPGAADVLRFAWDFDFDGGDFHKDAEGTTSVTLMYPDGPDTHQIAFRARDDDYPYPTDNGGQIGESIRPIHIKVNNVAPVPKAGGPYYAHPGYGLTLSGSGTDVQADDLTYAWNLDGDGNFETIGQSPTYTWGVSGIYTVALRVTDKDGASRDDAAQVSIGNRVPTVDAGGHYTATEGITLTLMGHAVDPDADHLTYTWDVNHDGVGDLIGSDVGYVWPDDGDYTVTLKVEDGWDSVEDVATVKVSNALPVAHAHGPYSATIGVPLTLTGTANDVLSDTLTFAWDLDGDPGFEVPGAVVTHTWSSTGTYTVSLEVRDDDNGQGVDTTTVNVNTVVPLAWSGIVYLLIRRRPGVRRRMETRQHADSYSHGC
jgi:PKD repeat protein